MYLNLYWIAPCNDYKENFGKEHTAQHYLLQKGSAILKDANHLIDMAKQMGLIGAQIEAALTNVTKCASWLDIEASHVATDHAPLTIKAFYGCLILLTMGLCGSFIGFCAEKFTSTNWKSLTSLQWEE